MLLQQGGCDASAILLMKRKRERRTLLLAILASILLHFAVAISLASFGDKLQHRFRTTRRNRRKLTLVDLAPPPPAVNKNAPFHRYSGKPADQGRAKGKDIRVEREFDRSE